LTRAVERIYEDADRIGWSDLSSVKRSAQYKEWVSDPDVGGLLAAFMSPSQSRLWIKDGPMKEWARARAGVGKYAWMAPQSSQSPEVIVAMTLGSSWAVETESLRVKPLRVTVTGEQASVVLAWGPERDFKHLLWAALLAAANGDGREWVICVVDSFTKPTPSNVRSLQQRIADRCNLRMFHLTI
jgi:hypothetical protein